MNTNNRAPVGKPSAPRQAIYRRRRQNGLQALPKPWDWLSLAEVQKLAVEAYRSATFALSDPDDQTSSPRAYFVSELVQAFEVLIAGKAQALGVPCAPAHAEHYAECLRARVPDSWRPQYPLYRPCPLPRGIGGVDPDEAKRDGIESSGQS